MSLKTRILTLVLGLLIIGVWGFATRMAAVLRADIEKLVSEQLSTQVNYVADELDKELQFRIELPGIFDQGRLGRLGHR